MLFTIAPMKHLLWLLLLVPAAEAATFDPGAQFSATSNPNGVWSYGQDSLFNNPPFDGPLTLLPYFRVNSEGLQLWDSFENPTAWNTAIYYNPTSTTITDPNYGVVGAGQLGFSAYNGADITLRFTAPMTSLYNISGSFYGQNQNTIDSLSDVYILKDGVSIFNGAVLGFGLDSAFNMNLTLDTGDYLDFTVDTGSGIGLSLDIATVPEPASLSLLAFGVLWITLLRRKA
jgi:hypothetical protein